MKIEIRKSYRDGHGNLVNIMGRTKERRDWYWSIQGEWYTEEGYAIHTYRVPGDQPNQLTIAHRPHHADSPYNLVERAPEDDKWFEGVKHP